MRHAKKVTMRDDLAHYTCYRTAGPITIDGKLDEPSWRAAPRSEPFVDIVTGEPAWFDTRVAMLWDDDCLYFGFTAEEPHVRGYLTERDSRIYEDNDVEVFIAGRNAYYEFEINALNTIYEVFWIWKDSLVPGSPYYGRAGVRSRDPAHHGARWRRRSRASARRALGLSGLGLSGTAARGARGAPPGWTVELALPWDGLARLADGRALPPRDGDVWRIDCSRFQQFDRAGNKLDPSAGWTWNRHGHYDSHIPETFTFVEFSDKPVSA